MNFVDLRNIWRICREILPFQKSNEKPGKAKQKQRKNIEQTDKNNENH